MAETSSVSGPHFVGTATAATVVGKITAEERLDSAAADSFAFASFERSPRSCLVLVILVTPLLNTN